MLPATSGFAQSGLMDPLQMAAFNNIARLQQDPSGSLGGAPAFNVPSAGMGDGSGFGLNLPTAQLGIQGIASLAGILGGFKQLSLANKQFKYTKKVTDTNLNNQTKTYNTALTDKINARASVTGMSADQANAYLSENRLKEFRG